MVMAMLRIYRLPIYFDIHSLGTNPSRLSKQHNLSGQGSLDGTPT